MKTNDELRLVRPEDFVVDDLSRFREEMMDSDSGADAYAGCCRIEQYQHIPTWVEWTKRVKDKIVKPLVVPTHTFLAVRQKDDKIVGIIELHPKLYDKGLCTCCSHISLTVRPCERNKGYGTEMLRLMLEKCRKIQMRAVSLSCGAENMVADQMIKTNGGKFDREGSDGKNILRLYTLRL